MSYTPKNNFNLQLGRTGIGKRGFRKKILADVACCNNLKGYEYYGGFPLETSLEFSRDMVIHGGCPNFSWEVVNSVYFTFAHATTAGRTNTVNADPTVPIDAEETAIVEDHCGHKLVFSILYCGGGISITPLPPIPPDPPDDPPYDPPWPPDPPPPPGGISDPNMSCDYENSDETIARNDSALVVIKGYNRPFRWSVAGIGYSMNSEYTSSSRNILLADHTACGTAAITVKGCDNRSIICYVRGLEGQWIPRGSPPDGECIISGTPTSQVGATCYLIKGKYKLVETKYYTSLCSVGTGCTEGACSPDVCPNYSDRRFYHCIQPYDCSTIGISADGNSVRNGCCCNHPGLNRHYGMQVTHRYYYEWIC